MADNRVKQAREARGWTQSDLHKVANIPLSTIQKIEHKQRTPLLDHALGIAEALGEPVERLFMRSSSHVRLDTAANEPAAPEVQHP